MSAIYRERAPDAALNHWVECSWSIDTTAPLAEHAVPPDGCLDILFSENDGLRVVGAMTVERRHGLPAGARNCGIRFRPGMAGAILRAAPAELTDRVIPLEDLWGAAATRELDARIRDVEAAGVRESLLRAAIRQPARAPGIVERAIAAIVRVHGDVDLDYIANQANLSPRQFRRRCLEESGLTPKHLCRVLRFRHARLQALESPRPDWPGIAADTGYFDQAHLIRDFREFTGRTPVDAVAPGRLMSVFSNTGACPLD